MKLFKKDYIKKSDEDLMRLYIKGDRKAFEQIYERYGNYVLNFFYRKLWQDREKAEDFTQEVFTKIIDKPNLFDPSKKFKSWLFTVAANMCKNEYKKQEIRKDSRNDLPEGFEAKSNSIGADNLVDENNFGATLKIELSKLKDTHREVFMLRHFEGLSMKEIADVLEINEGTVKSRLHNVTKQLAGRLEVFKKLIVE
jgi:RNA polymerase sigma-70 factor (ECF subfamily)